VKREVLRILRDRAQALARIVEPESPGPTHALASFSVGGHVLAVLVQHLGRVATLRSLTEIPAAPEWMVGISSVEGHVVSLLDPIKLLGLPRRGVGDLTMVVVVAAQGREVGLLAEQLHGIDDVLDRDVVTLPSGGVLSRLARHQGSELLIVDVPTLLADPRLSPNAASHG
jgi:chemotaxis signal transduction protein